MFKLELLLGISLILIIILKNTRQFIYLRWYNLSVEFWASTPSPLVCGTWTNSITWCWYEMKSTGGGYVFFFFFFSQSLHLSLLALQPVVLTFWHRWKTEIKRITTKHIMPWLPTPSASSLQLYRLLTVKKKMKIPLCYIVRILFNGLRKELWKFLKPLFLSF